MRSYQVVNGENILAQNITNIRADARASSFLLPHQTLGSFDLSTNFADGKTVTLTINGTAVVLTGHTGAISAAGDFKIGGTAATTAANILALLNQPQITTANGVALSTANQTLVGYLTYALNGTTLYISSSNTGIYAPLTSFSASTNATSDSWTGNTMALFVEKGVVYVNGTRVIFGGSLTPTVTAPGSNPRIDVLTVDSSGTLAWTTGTENASPSAPTYPVNKVALCELYNVVGETALYDNDNQTAGQGYVLNDVRPTLGTSFSPTAISSSLLPASDGTYDLGSNSFEWNNIYAKTGIFLNGVSINSQTTSSFTAAESISAGAALALGYYQSDGGIKLDTSKSSGQASGTSVSDSITVANNSNRCVVVVITSAHPISAVTLGGVSTTQIDAQTGANSDVYVYVGYVLNPTAGSVALAATIGSTGGTNWALYSYYNVAQSGTVAAHNIANVTSNGDVSPTITPGEIGDLVFGYISSTGTSGGETFTLTGTPNNTQIPTARLVSGFFGTGDNGQAANTTTQTVTFTHSGTLGNPDVIYGTFSLKPATAASLAVVNANSANKGSYTTPTSIAFRYLAFIGFASNGASAGGSVTVVTGGIATGLSGLTAGLQYYLNDGNGTVGTSAGTNTRKVGIATDSTHMLVTNIW